MFFKEDVLSAIKTVSAVIAAVGFCATLFISKISYDMQLEVEDQDSLRLAKENLPVLNISLDSTKYTLFRDKGALRRFDRVQCIVGQNPMFNIEMKSYSAPCFELKNFIDRYDNVHSNDTIEIFISRRTDKIYTDSLSRADRIAFSIDFEDRLRNNYHLYAIRDPYNDLFLISVLPLPKEEKTNVRKN